MRRASRQGDTQFKTAVQLIHKLAAVAARGIVDGDGAQGFFAAQPGVTDGALLRVNGLLHGRTEKLHVSAEVPGPAHAARNCAYVKMGKVSAGAGSRQGQQGESQRVFVQPRCLFKRRDLICRQQGGEMRIRQNRSQG